MAHDNKFDNTNPKQEILTLGNGTFEIAEPMFLASWQHGYVVGPSDHQLFLTINPEITFFMVFLCILCRRRRHRRRFEH
jgi:hypothetical protein